MPNASTINIKYSAKFPKIIIYQFGQDELLPQDYKNYEIVKSDIIDNNSIKCYMYPGYNFAHKDVFNTVVEKWDEYPEVEIMYGDLNNRFNISFNMRNLNQNTVINIPLFSKKPLSFNSELKRLFYFECILRMSQQAIIYHICKPLFTISNYSQQDYVEDLKKIYAPSKT